MCQKKHNSLLHDPSKQSTSSSKPEGTQSSTSTVPTGYDSSTSSSKSSKSASDGTASSSHGSITTSHVLLETALVSTKNTSGSNQFMRVFVDSGAEGELITSACVDSLGLKLYGSPPCLTGL